MMFSDVIGVANALLSLHPGAFAPLLMFALVFWIAGKLFRAWILNGHWALLLLAALFFYTLAAQMVRDGQYVLALVFGGPLLLIGQAGYKRLLNPQ
jgi:hypothetical protein